MQPGVVRDVDFLTISLTGTDPVRTANILNAIADQFVALVHDHVAMPGLDRATTPDEVGDEVDEELGLEQEVQALEAERGDAGHTVSRQREHGVEHRFREPAGEGVLLAGMITADQPPAVGQRRLCSMRKGRTLA